MSIWSWKSGSRKLGSGCVVMGIWGPLIGPNQCMRFGQGMLGFVGLEKQWLSQLAK